MHDLNSAWIALIIFIVAITIIVLCEVLKLDEV